MSKLCLCSQRMDDEAYLSLAQMLTLDVMATNVDGQHQFQAEDGTLVNGGGALRVSCPSVGYVLLC